MAENDSNKIRSGQEAIIPLQAEIIDTADDILVVAQRRCELAGRMIEMALKRTNYLDWVNQQGKPYLIHSGAEKVARLFGVSLRNIETKKEWAEDTLGRYYIYKTTGTAFLGRLDSIEALGTCSQRDKFFAYDGKKKTWKDTAEIDETNIMKASYTNFVVNGITHLLGLRNLTWEQLKAAGITQDRVQAVEYKTPEKATPAPATKPAESPATMKEPSEPKAAPAIENPAAGSEQNLQQKVLELWETIGRLNNFDIAQCEKMLYNLSCFKDKEGKWKGIKNQAELQKASEKWVDNILKKAREFEATKKAQSESQDPNDEPPF
jgi:hypothetical protein